MVLSNSTSTSKTALKALKFSLVYKSKKEAAKVIFDEILQLVDNDGCIVDEVTISVEPSNDEEEEFEVFQYSRDEKHFLKSRSQVTSSLETKSELRKIGRDDKEKLIRVTNLPDKYKVFKVETDLQQRSGSRFTTDLPKPRNKQLILEGANVLFLRKIALNRQIGGFTAETIDNNGEVCEASYMVETLPQGEAKVTRTVGSETMTTVLNSYGRILYHKWSNSQWRLRSSAIRMKSEYFEGISVPQTILGQSGSEESESLPEVDLPAYWQKKEEVIIDLKQYMVENSDVEDMIADLMKNILFEKPDDPIEYADKFLSEFAGIAREPDSENEEQFVAVHHF